MIINGKQMDAGRFLFNLDDTKKDQIEADLKRKLKEFFDWYSSFQNKDPISQIELCTIDFKCTSCNFSPNLSSRFSVIDVLIDKRKIVALLEELTKKYHMELILKNVA